MYEQMEILPKYMLKCHLGPTKTQKKKKKTQWDKAQSTKLKNFDMKISFPNPFQKITQP